MLQNKDYKDIDRTLSVIAETKDTTRIPFATILAILDFILIGIKTIFFDKMGKPKNKLQLILSLPAILRFVAEVVKMISTGVKPTNRVKGITNEAKVDEAIKSAVKRTKRD